MVWTQEVLLLYNKYCIYGIVCLYNAINTRIQANVMYVILEHNVQYDIIMDILYVMYIFVILVKTNTENHYFS